MESQAELAARIAQCNQQMNQVNELLQLDPGNSQFLQLKEDLQNLIELTKALLLKAIEEEKSIPVAISIPSSAATQQSSHPVARDPLPAKTGAIGVGEVVEVTGGDRLFAGVVTDIIGPNEYKVKYFEYPAEVSLPLSSLQRLPLSFYTADKVQVGLTCQCKYATDQNYYDCKVTALTPYGCTVTYTAYGNSEEVPLAYLKPITSAAAKPTGKMSGKHATTAPGGLIPIPDSLQILPTDTEKEIEKKKKELKSIKNKNRLITQETEMKEAQNSWKKFVTKGTKRLDSGIVKNSMFSSTEEVAGKVGVVNSGKKMTEFVARKKHKFDTF